MKNLGKEAIYLSAKVFTTYFECFEISLYKYYGNLKNGAKYPSITSV